MRIVTKVADRVLSTVLPEITAGACHKPGWALCSLLLQGTSGRKLSLSKVLRVLLRRRIELSARLYAATSGRQNIIVSRHKPG